jgi:hypothetical protein
MACAILDPEMGASDGNCPRPDKPLVCESGEYMQVAVGKVQLEVR